MGMYCVRLKEGHQISSFEIIEKIKQLELETPKERFPIVTPPESAFESYFYGKIEECQQFIETIDNELRDLFECCKCEPN